MSAERAAATRRCTRAAISSTGSRASITTNRSGSDAASDRNAGPHPLVEVRLLGLETVERLVVGIQPLTRRGRVEVQQHRDVGECTLGRPQRQLPHLVGIQHPARALIGDRRVEVPVLDDHLAAGEGRPDDRGHVVGAVGGVQQGLGPGRDVAAVVQHDVADEHAHLGATRLAGAHDRASLLFQPGLQQGRLRGLPGAVAAFERDPESAGAGHFFAAGLRVVVLRAAARFLGAGPLARLSASS